VSSLKENMDTKLSLLQTEIENMDSKFKHIVDHTGQVGKKLGGNIEKLTKNIGAEFAQLKKGQNLLSHFALQSRGYVDGVVPGRNLYLKVFSEKKNWNDARKKCLREGGDLVMVDDVRINNWLGSMKSKFGDIWIGATDQANEGTYLWTNGSPVPSQYWKQREPNDCCGGQDCAVVNHGAPGQWDDRKCDQPVEFACQIELN